MVLIGGVKYACERCIRGHRVTTCNHTDQPLIMIKPKGRPSSQCKHCKNLRVSKNVHSSSACTCGKEVNGAKKKCCCEKGKPCDCHRKKKPVKKTSPKGEEVRKPTSFESTSVLSVNNEGSYSSKRAGEVVLPVSEYQSNHPQGELGSVFNERALFQDVPLPFETGHGLLDLFEPTTVGSSSAASNLSTDSRPRNYYYSSYTKNNNNNNNNNESNDNRNRPVLHINPSSSSIPPSGPNGVTLPKNHALNNHSFDLFHSLGLSPTTEPQSMTPTGHPLPRRNQAYGSINNISSTPPTTTGSNDYKANDYKANDSKSSDKVLQQPSTGSLFGSYSGNYPSRPQLERAESVRSVEVCSVTPSFNDLKHTDFTEPSGDSSNTKQTEDDNVPPEVADMFGYTQVGFGFENELKKLKNDGAEFPEMLKF